MSIEEVRLFIALPISDELVSRILDFRAEHEEALRGSTSRFRWTSAENLHVTLLFIGEQPVSRVPDLIEAGSCVFAMLPKLSFAFKGFAYGPPGRDPRMVWGVFAESKEFENAYAQIFDALNPMLARKLVYRKPASHITLARFENPVGPSLPLLGKSEAALEFTCENCELMRSTLTPKGPIYKSLATFGFK